MERVVLLDIIDKYVTKNSATISEAVEGLGLARDRLVDIWQNVEPNKRKKQALSRESMEGSRELL